MTQGPTIYPAEPFKEWQPGAPQLTKAQILAVKSLFSGTATQPQQLMVLEVIIKRLARTYEICVDPKYAEKHEGCRMVGYLLLQINDLDLNKKPVE